MTPTTMRAAALDRFGGPAVLTIHTLPVPEPNANEVLIALQAAGVGTWDVGFVDGTILEGKARFPYIPGLDGAGRRSADRMSPAP